MYLEHDLSAADPDLKDKNAFTAEDLFSQRNPSPALKWLFTTLVERLKSARLNHPRANAKSKQPIPGLRYKKGDEEDESDESSKGDDNEEDDIFYEASDIRFTNAIGTVQILAYMMWAGRRFI